MEVFLQSEKLITALIASGSALFGVLLSQVIGFMKQKFEHKYERQIFLREKYEELSFRIIDFTNILKTISSQLSQLESGANIDTAEFDEKGAKIEIITVLYFPELTIDCEYFLEISRKFFLAHGSHDSFDNVDSREMLQVRFNEAFDTLYNKIKNHISDYT